MLYGRLWLNGGYKMKKCIMFICVIMIIFSISGCNENSSSDSTSNEKICTFSSISEIYKLDASNTDMTINEVTEKLLVSLLTDVSKQKDNLGFRIVEYKDLEYNFIDDNSMEENKNLWHIDASVYVKYEGTISPIGPANIIPDNEFVLISLGEWYIEKNDNVYYLMTNDIYKSK